MGPSVCCVCFGASINLLVMIMALGSGSLIQPGNTTLGPGLIQLPFPIWSLLQVPLFKDCEEAFIRYLVMKLKLHVYLQGEIVFHMGDVGHEMYFITKVGSSCYGSLSCAG